MKKLSNIFPYMILRVAGGSLDEFRKINLQKTVKTINELFKLEQVFTTEKEILSNNLHAYISNVSDIQERNLFIKIRRDLYNGKIIHYPSENILKTLPESLARDVKKACAIIEKMEEITKKSEQQFQTEMVQSKYIFSKLLKNPNFRNGLILSSDTINSKEFVYESLTRNKNASKLERSLTKYLSRMYTKPSPFSTFTFTALASFEKADTQSVYLSSKKRGELLHTVQLNHLLLRHFLTLLTLNNDLNKYLPLTMNMTIEKNNTHFNFLINKNNREWFKKVQIVDANSLVYTLFKEKTTWIYRELVNELEKQVTASKEQLQQFIDSLIEVGFLEFSLGISARDTKWPSKLISLLVVLEKDFQEVSYLINSLQKVIDCTQSYETASSIKRNALLHAGYSELVKISELLRKVATNKVKKASKKNTFAFAPHDIWYEDSYMKNNVEIASSIKKPLAILGIFLKSMDRFDTCIEEQYKMAYFFEEKYGSESEIDLLVFFKDYVNREAKVSFSKRAAVPGIQKRRTENKKWLHLFLTGIEEKLICEDQINLYLTDMPQIKPMIVPKAPASFGAFFHIIQNSKEVPPQIAINAITPGFGRLYSRFLPLFDPAVTKALLSYNTKIPKDALFSEATDASFYNGNLHPRLAQFEITSPGGYYSLSSAKRIAIADIAVRYSKKTNRLELIHKKKKKTIYVYDIDFQKLTTRSKLYQLLCTFTISTHHSYQHLIRVIERYKKQKIKKNVVIVIPRVVYENCIVLSRKKWIFPKILLPIMESQETLSSYFRKVILWRLKNNIPEEVFIFEKGKKPQYISFANPFTVSLFERLIHKIITHMQIEEMLPNSDSLVKFRGENTVTEVLSQWYY